jgi:hypothetical protein
MIPEILEVSQFSELTPFLVVADPCGWLLEATIQSRDRQLR